MKYVLCILFLLFVSGVYAECVNINSASINKLDELVGIGPVKAQAIIDERPFEEIDDLIEVYGIGEKTLEKIKDQGLACVEEEIIEKNKENKKESLESNLVEDTEPKTRYIELEAIELNSLEKDIKSEDNNENKTDYAKYGFIGFCILLAFLFVLKKPKVQELD